MQARGEDVPVCLLKPDGGHKGLVLVEDTVQLLRRVHDPVSVVCVTGPPRAGRSSLLNLLSGRRLNGFGARPQDEDAAGVWILLCPHPRNPRTKIAFVDVEGLEDPRYLFVTSAVTLLLSTLFIYQTKGIVDQTAIGRLDAILKLAEQIRGGTDASANPTERASFLWLMRDHQPSEHNDSREEMMGHLNLGAKASLRRCFKDVDCHPLSRPTENVENRSSLESHQFAQLDEGFREEFVVLEQRVHDVSSKPRTLAGRPMNGEILVDLLNKLMAFIPGGDPASAASVQIPTRKQIIVQMIGERAVASALATYKGLMEEAIKDMPVETSTLQAEHKRAKEEAMARFEREVAADMEEMASFRAQLRDAILDLRSSLVVLAGEGHIAVQKPVAGAFQDLLMENWNRSKEVCERVATTLYGPIRTRLEGHEYNSLEEFHDDLRSFRAQYETSEVACGPAKASVLVTFQMEIAEDRESALCAIMERRVERHMEKRLQTQKASHECQTGLIDEKLGKLMGDVSSLKERMDEQVRQTSNELQELQEVAQSHQLSVRNTIESVDKEVQRRLSSLDARLTTLQSSCTEEITSSRQAATEELSCLRESLDEICSDTTRQYTQLQHEVQQGTRTLEEKVASLAENVQQAAGSQSEQLVELEERIRATQVPLREGHDAAQAELRIALTSLVERRVDTIETNIEKLRDGVTKRAEHDAAATEEKVEVLTRKMDVDLGSLRESVHLELKKINHRVEDAHQMHQDELHSHDDTLRSVIFSRVTDLQQHADSIHDTLKEIVETNARRIDEIDKHVEDLVKVQLPNSQKSTEEIWEHTIHDVVNIQRQTESLNERVEELQHTSDALSQRVDENTIKGQKGLADATHTLDTQLRAHIDERVVRLNERQGEVDEHIRSMFPELRKMLESVQETIEDKWKLAFEELQEKIDSNSNDFSATIPDLKHLVHGMQDDMEALSEETQNIVRKTEAQLQTLTVQISEQIPDLQEKLQAFQDQSGSSLQEFTEGFQKTFAALHARIDALQSDLEQQVPETRQRITQVQEDITTHVRELNDDAQRQISQNVERLVGLNNEMNERIPDLRRALVDLEGRLGASMAAISEENEKNMINLQGTFTSTTEDIHTQIPELRKDLDAIQEKLDYQLKYPVAENQKRILSLQEKLQSIDNQFRIQIPELRKILGIVEGKMKSQLKSSMDDSMKHFQALQKQIDLIKNELRFETNTSRDSTSALWESLKMMADGEFGDLDPHGDYTTHQGYS